MWERATWAIEDKEPRMMKVAVDVDKDVSRTLITTHEFMPQTSNAVRLKQLLCTLAYSRPDMGYAQGMNMYMGLLLLNCKNVDAFVIMSNLLCVPVLRACLSSNIEVINVYAAVFAQLLSSQASKVHKHLVKSGYMFETYVFDSAASLFCNNFPPATAEKIWDAILDNPEVGLMRVGISVFKVLEKLILTKSADEIMMIVKHPCQQATEEAILKMLSKTTIRQKDYDAIKEKAMTQGGIKDPIPV